MWRLERTEHQEHLWHLDPVESSEISAWLHVTWPQSQKGWEMWLRDCSKLCPSKWVPLRKQAHQYFFESVSFSEYISICCINISFIEACKSIWYLYWEGLSWQIPVLLLHTDLDSPCKGKRLDRDNISSVAFLIGWTSQTNQDNLVTYVN